MDVLSRRLLFVSGKGGVGKTTVAAGLAELAAADGARVLVCEIDAKGDLAAAFETAPLRFAAREVHPGVHAMAMDTEESLKEYLSLQLRVPRLTRIGPLARTLDFVASAAPGVREILTVGKLCWEVRERHFDLVVVDAAASGHLVGHLSAPAVINDLVRVGAIRDQTRWMLDLLGDPAVTGAVLVTTPEEMPVTETIELVERLRAETVVDVATVVVNRVLPELFGRGEEALFTRLREREATDALAAEAGEGVRPVLDAAELAVRLRRAKAVHLSRLREQLDPAIPVLYLPELFTRTSGVRATRRVAAALGDELG